MNTTISTPVTYKLFFEWHGGFTSHPHTYYSLAQALDGINTLRINSEVNMLFISTPIKVIYELQEINVDNLCEA